jgi:hypothetical protein
MKNTISWFRALLQNFGRLNLYDSPWGERVMHQVFREAEFREQRSTAGHN